MKGLIVLGQVLDIEETDKAISATVHAGRDTVISYTVWRDDDGSMPDSADMLRGWGEGDRVAVLSRCYVAKNGRVRWVPLREVSAEVA